MDITVFFEKKEIIKKPKKKRLKSKYVNILTYLTEKGVIDLLEYKRMIDLSTNGILIHNNYFCNVLKKVLYNKNISNKKKKKFKKIIREEFPNIKFIIKEEIKIKKKSIINNCYNIKDNLKFTNDQKKGIKKIINFLTNNNISSYGLYGYAGTGKTTLIVNLISFLLKKRLINSVVFTAPTNKAVNIMKSKFRNEISNLLDDEIVKSFDKNITFQEQLRLLTKSGYNINFLTIHKLLSFKNEFNSSGDKVFQKGENSTVNRYDLIIMDECSMLSLHVIIHLFDEIIKLKKDTTRISVPKILFVGDPAQLPPVNESNSSIFSKKDDKFSFNYFCSLLKDEKYDSNGYYNEVVDEDNLMSRYNNLKSNIINQKEHILKEIVRSNNNNILAVCMNIRDWVLKKIRIPMIRKFVGSGVEVYKKKDSTDKFINSFINIALNAIVL